jgi:hypothetical protein
MGEYNNQADKDRALEIALAGNEVEREPRHLQEAVYWLVNRKSINATANHFKHIWNTVKEWSVNEDWEGWSRLIAESMRDAYVGNLLNLSDSVRDFFSVGGTISTVKDAIAALKLIQSELGGASAPDKVHRIEISTGDADAEFNRIIADPELARKLQDLAGAVGRNSGDVSAQPE